MMRVIGSPGSSVSVGGQREIRRLVAKIRAEKAQK
jgi:hypothetical protein